MTKVFISYRRGGSNGWVQNMRARIDAVFGKGTTFLDVTSMRAGDPFPDVLRREAESCDVMLAVVGPDWSVPDDGPLSKSKDWVRHELAIGLTRNITVIPVLVDGGTIPVPANLPTELEPLTERQAIEVIHGTNDDLQVLIDRVQITAETRAAKSQLATARAKHSDLIGRDETLAAVRRHLDDPKPDGRCVLVTGAPGTGKSAILTHLLTSPSASADSPHYFVRRDQPTDAAAVCRSLGRQLEDRLTLHSKASGDGSRFLAELLQQVSAEVLQPRNTRLLVVIDALDEIAMDASPGNPLARILPTALPPGVTLLVSSRPTTHLSWLEGRGDLRRVDLDHATNAATCREFWRHHASEFTPPLDQEHRERLVESSQGSLLHARAMLSRLRSRPDQRDIDRIPEGPEGIFAELWQRLAAEHRVGLQCLCASFEPLPVAAIRRLFDDQDDAFESFMSAVRPWLDQLADSPSPSYRPYHESLREFVIERAGFAIEQIHGRILDRLAAWRPGSRGFERRYALSYAIRHCIAATRIERARGLGLDIEFLTSHAEELGASETERDVARAAAANPSDRELRALLHAMRSESQWLHHNPSALPGLLFNQLVNAGWSQEQIISRLHFGSFQPLIRLRQPVQLGGAERRTLTGHDSFVNACAVSPDGRHVVAGGLDDAVCVWDLETGALLHRWTEHESHVQGCAITVFGQVVSCSHDQTIRVWDLASGQLRRTIPTNSDALCCTVTPDGSRVVAGLRSGELRLWDLQTGELVRTLERGHDEAVRDCMLAADGRTLVSAGGCVTLWDLDSGRILQRIPARGAWVCAISADGRTIASADSDSGKTSTTIQIHDARSGELRDTLDEHTWWVRTCAFSPDGKHLVSGAMDGTMLLWQMPSGRVLRKLLGHNNDVRQCVVTPDGQSIVTASDDHTVKIWDLAASGRSMRSAAHPGAVTSLCSDGDRLLSTDAQHGTRLWDAETAELLQVVRPSNRGNVSWAPDSRAPGASILLRDGRAVMSTGDHRAGTLHLWSADCVEAPKTIVPGGPAARFLGLGPMTPLCVTPDGRHLMVDTGRRLVLLTQPDLEPTDWQLHGLKTYDRVMDCAISPDGQHVAVAVTNCTPEYGEIVLHPIYSRDKPRVLGLRAGRETGAYSCAISPEGTHLICGRADGSVEVWNLETASIEQTWRHRRSVYACVFLQDGRVATAGADASIRVWSESGDCELQVFGAAPFWSLAAVRAGLLAAGDDRGNIWHLEY